MAYRLEKCYREICEELIAQGDTGMVDEKRITLLLKKKMNISNPEKAREHIRGMIELGFIEMNLDKETYHVVIR